MMNQNAIALHNMGGGVGPKPVGTHMMMTTTGGHLSDSIHQQQQPKSSPPKCYGCHKPILDRYFLKALDQIWHEDCLKCSCCDCRLGEVGSTLFTKANLILCKRDYLR